MNTKYVMTSSALLMIAAGISCLFAPQEISAAFLPGTDPMLLKIFGALYFSFGMVNWTARESLIGGIYGRPVLIGNVSHFVIGALTLVRWISEHSQNLGITAVAGIYLIFSLLFTLIFFRHPTEKK